MSSSLAPFLCTCTCPASVVVPDINVILVVKALHHLTFIEKSWVHTHCENCPDLLGLYVCIFAVHVSPSYNKSSAIHGRIMSVITTICRMSSSLIYMWHFHVEIEGYSVPISLPLKRHIAELLLRT